MFTRTVRRFTAGAMLLCALAGCESKFVATTVLHADGSVDREIHQPVADSPPVEAKQGWSEPTIAKDTSLGAGNKEYLTARDAITDRIIAQKYGDRAAFDMRLGSLLV